MVPMKKRPGPELRQSLRPVNAPPELWDRIQTQRTESPRATNRPLVWAMAAAVVIMTVGLSVVHRDNVAFPAFAGDRCENPAQIRSWVRAKTDMSQSLELTGAQTIDGARVVKIASNNRADLQLACKLCHLD